MGTDMTTAFPTKYFSAQDVNEQGVMLNVQNIQFESVDPDLSKPQKPVVYFQGNDKGLVLNVTNNNTIIEMYGGDSDGWIGKPIILFKTFVDFGGKVVPAIRVRPGAPAAQVGQPAPAQPAPAQSAAPAVPGPNYETGDPLNYDV